MEKRQQAAKSQPASLRWPRDFDAFVHKWMEETFGADSSLSADDDWTLVVRLHAMVETALNTVLVKKFRKPELRRVIAKLETSNTATGKVAFAKALKILFPETAVFITKLSELRNHCVHDIRNFKFDLEKYLADPEDENKKKAIVKAMMNEIIEGTHVSSREALRIATMSVIEQLSVEYLRCEAAEAQDKLLRLKAERFDEQNQSTSKE